MKTVEIIRLTGEFEDQEIIVKDEDGKDVKQTVQIEIAELINSFECKDGDENQLLYRARLTAELRTRKGEGNFRARIKNEATEAES